MTRPDIIGTPDIELRPERINLHAGTVIRTVASSEHRTWPVDPPFIVPEDGYYRAIIDTTSDTASMERVYPPNRWAAFTTTELTALAFATSEDIPARHLHVEIAAELDRRKP